ncbi:MAG: hypothetical protein ACJAZ9_000459 [Neolewinella sp.]
MHKFTRFFFLLLAFQIAVSSCSSTKRRDEQGPIGKLWHNMNSHYNGYFNARELMTESLLTLDEQHVDNYTQRLEMFPFLAVDNASIVAEDMDVAIEKVAIVVKKHPYSNWVDDSYLLVGQAQLVKQDYESAEKTLRFLTTEFRPRPKRKKSKSRKAGTGEEETKGDDFKSRREVEASPEQDRKDRLRARKDAEKERDKVRKERTKERKKEKKAREQDRKARARARKKGIKLPPKARPDTSAITGLEDEPEPDVLDELGPVGMISIFNGSSNLDDKGESYGQKPDSYIVKHRPAYQEGRLWLAWTLIKRDNFDRAQLILEDMRADRGTFPEIRRKAMAVQAFLYIEQERLEEAIPYLEEAAEVANERNERARYYYIAGQLNQELSNPAAAASNFEEAIAARPNYELELGARLNLAQNAYLSGSGTPEDALKKLKRMAKEEKNIPYESQIYFSMAAIALRSDDQVAGKEYLRMALNSPSAGPVQQLEAYKLLGDLAYADNSYLPAKLYYDSTLTVMAKNDERFEGVTELRDKLEGIATLLQDITLKDSLLRIGLLPEEARNKWASDLFEAKRAAAAVPINPVVDAGRGRPQAPVLGNSSFFAYNTSVMKKGKRDFERRWGDRELTDNWRRGSAAREANIFNDAGDAPTEEAVQIVTEDEIKVLLNGIPTTESEQKTMQLQLSEHWFNLGREYRDRLEDLPKSLDAFETLNKEFPGAATQAESWYYQYLIHKQLGNTAKAAEFADKLDKGFRGSKYALLANEPGYADELLAKDNKLSREYEVAYSAFEKGDYKTAHELATKGRTTLIGQHPLKPRYALLLAMTTGNTQGRPAYVAALRQVVAQFSGTPEETRAKEILRLLGESGARLPGRNGRVGGGFKESMKELHYVLIVFNKKDIKLNDAKLSASEFNSKYNKLDRLRITNVYLGEDNDTPVLVMRRFKTGQAAVKYLDNAKEREKEFLNAGKFDYDIFAVSQSNYREILKSRSAVEYKEWYKENYK